MEPKQNKRKTVTQIQIIGSKMVRQITNTKKTRWSYGRHFWASSTKSRTHLHFPAYAPTHKPLHMQMSTMQQYMFKKSINYRVYSIIN